ncbi:MAG: hypothetical protein IJK19_02640 [Bacteroidales bacterium]|nr:hypothetical protein [Bacteroidales bacterium]
MKNLLRERDVTSFLLNAYFGKVDSPVHTAANTAYLDLNRTIEFKKSKTISVKQKKELRQRVVDTIIASIKDIKSKDAINQVVFDNWHRDLCRAIIKIYSDKGIKIYYGQAQKWVNMTFKYLSVINRAFTSEYFKFLHAPIDSIVIDIASDGFHLKRPDIRWSRMDEKEYIDYQNRLRSVSHKNNLCPMLWEFRIWER